MATGLLFMMPGGQAIAQVAPTTRPLAAPELDEQRGGFDIPGGIAVTLGVNTFTSIDGRAVLQSTFRIADGLSQTSVMANGGGGLVSVDPALNGAGVITADGVLRLASSSAGTHLILAGEGTDITHLIGQSLGSIVSNSADNRSIDSATVVDIGLSGVTPDALGGSLAQVESLALASTVLLNR